MSQEISHPSGFVIPLSNIPQEIWHLTPNGFCSPIYTYPYIALAKYAELGDVVYWGGQIPHDPCTV